LHPRNDNLTSAVDRHTILRPTTIFMVSGRRRRRHDWLRF